MNHKKSTPYLFIMSRMKWLVAAAALTYVAASQAQTNGITLEAYLATVSQNNAHVQAAALKKRAAKLKKRQNDLKETPFALQADAGIFDDSRETAMVAQQGTNTKGKQYSFALSKTFSTGTAVSAKWGQTFTDTIGTIGFVIQPRWESLYQIGVSQSLWKNSFGRATRLRHEREDAMERVAILEAEKSGRQALIKAEEAYWDLVVKTLDIREKDEALKRAEKISAWTAKRFTNGIGDRADTLQIDALVATRKLEQLGARNAQETARRAFLDAIENPADQNIFPSTANLGTLRPLNVGGSGRQAIDVWMMQSQASAGETGAREAADAIRPDLSLQGAFGANARDASLGNSATSATGSDHNFYNVGIKLGVSLDFGLQNDIAAAARAEAKAARMIADKLNRDHGVSWREVVRQHSELSLSIALTEKLSKTLDEKLAREQTRLEIGRTTTAQVVTFEQEVASARQNLLELKSKQRKLEAQARLFLSQSEVEAM